MITITPEQFLEKFCRSFEPLDHHWSGPPEAQQAEGNGSVFHIEGKLLASFANRCGGPVLEIGSDLGISSRYIHEGLDRFDERCQGLGCGPTGDKLYCVDIYHKWSHDPSWPRRVRIDADSRTFQGQRYSWAFVDGSHVYDDVLADISTLARHDIRTAFFHDTSPVHPKAINPSHGSDARAAVLDAFDKTWNVYEILTPCGLMFVTKKVRADYDE